MIIPSYLVTLWALLFVSCGPTAAQSVAVFDFELIDTSLEGETNGLRVDAIVGELEAAGRRNSSSRALRSSASSQLRLTSAAAMRTLHHASHELQSVAGAASSVCSRFAVSAAIASGCQPSNHRDRP